WRRQDGGVQGHDREHLPGLGLRVVARALERAGTPAQRPGREPGTFGEWQHARDRDTAIPACPPALASGGPAPHGSRRILGPVRALRGRPYGGGYNSSTSVRPDLHALAPALDHRRQADLATPRSGAVLRRRRGLVRERQ